MDNKINYLDDIKSIKKMMEESSRFLSLSGLSGLFAGLIALAGGSIAYIVILKSKTLYFDDYFISLSVNEISNLKIQLIIDAALVLFLSISGSLYFSYKRSLRLGLKMWTPVSKSLLINLLIPLVTGGFFIIILCTDANWKFVIPLMLIFYGLSLVSVGKFTFNEIFYFGIAEIITGLVSALFPEYGILFWCFGFGILHITYGFFMYSKYER
jgi:hypothetical protein